MNTTATEHLENLAGELKARGWVAETRSLRGRMILYVQNPAVAKLNDTIACEGEVFRYTWGQGLGPVTEVVRVADRIQYVLRQVGS